VVLPRGQRSVQARALVLGPSMWQRPPAMAQVGQRATQVPPALEIARRIHAEVISANRDLYTRAQIVLTLDGIVLGATAAALAGKPGDLRRTINVFATTTWVALAVAGAALIASVLSCALALFSRHGRDPNAAAVRYEPKSMWYYARIAALNPEQFVERMAQADTDFEIRARLWQVAIMAPIMVRRARWVNRAFASTALSFVAFALAATDYVVRLA
jgi:hypothetical protein